MVRAAGRRRRRRRRRRFGGFGPGLAALAVRCAPPNSRHRDLLLGEAVNDVTCDFIVAVAAGKAMGEGRGRGHRQRDKENALVEDHCDGR